MSPKPLLVFDTITQVHLFVAEITGGVRDHLYEVDGVNLLDFPHYYEAVVRAEDRVIERWRRKG